MNAASSFETPTAWEERFRLLWLWPNESKYVMITTTNQNLEITRAPENVDFGFRGKSTSWETVCNVCMHCFRNPNVPNLGVLAWPQRWVQRKGLALSIGLTFETDCVNDYRNALKSWMNERMNKNPIKWSDNTSNDLFTGTLFTVYNYFDETYYSLTMNKHLTKECQINMI